MFKEEASRIESSFRSIRFGDLNSLFEFENLFKWHRQVFIRFKNTKQSIIFKGMLSIEGFQKVFVCVTIFEESFEIGCKNQ